MSDDKRHQTIILGHVSYSPDYKSVPPRVSAENTFGPIANADGSLPPRPSTIAKKREFQKRIDYYVKNYPIRTLAEMIVSLEDKHGIPPAID